MAKCAICGKSTLLNGSVKLADDVICGRCFKELGFGLLEASAMKAYPLELVRQGKAKLDEVKTAALTDEILKKAVEVHEPNIDCTKAERKVYEYIFDILMDINVGIDPDKADLIRDEDETLYMLIGGTVFAHYKAVGDKWIQFPLVSEQKIYFDKPEEMSDYIMTIVESAKRVV